MHGERFYLLDLTLLKTISIILVFLGLSTTMVFEGSDGGALESFAMRIYKVSELLVIPLFVMISGYLHRMTRGEKGPKRRTENEYIRRRSLILLSSYLAFGVLTLCVQVLVGNVSPGEAPLEFLHRILLGVGPYHLWFILMLLWVALSYHYLERIFRNDAHLGLSVLLISVLSTFIPGILLQLKVAGLFLLIYYVGNMIRVLEVRKSSLVSVRSLPVSVLLFLFFLLFFFKVDIVGTFPPPLDNMVVELLRLSTSILGSICVIITFRSLLRNVSAPRRFKRILESVHSHILGIYLFHLPVMLIFFWWTGSIQLPLLWSILLSFAFTLLVSYSLPVIIDMTYHALFGKDSASREAGY